MGFCYQKNFSNPTLPVDEAQFWALVKAAKWNENIDKFRETGDASLKRKLPAFIFQATFDETESANGKLGAWRKQAATRLTGLVVMDIDHVEEPKKLFEEWKGSEKEVKGESKGQYFKDLGILLIYITPSGKGLKIVFKADVKKGNLIDNQHAMAKVLGVEVDESCKDASRMSFLCKESDILYIDKELFTYENKEFAERYDALYRDGHSQATSGDFKPTNLPIQAESTSVGVLDEIKWRGYDVQSIIDARYGDKLPCQADSNRHTESLKLATDLLLMLDGDKTAVQRVVESQSWVKEIIDERNENVSQTVASAAECVAQKEKKYASSLPSKAMQEAIQKATGRTFQEITKTQTTRTVAMAEEDINRWLWEWGEQIEAMAEDFPLLKDICKGLKRNQYPAALFVAGGLMMTLMTRCTYRFYHRPEELRRLNNSTLIIGDPASGKSFATRLFKLLASPIVEADKIGKDAINAYREQMRTKGANKEKPKKPKVVVRIHPARTSNAQFIQDMVNAVEEVNGEPMQLHMLTFDTELDNTLSLQKGGSYIDKQALQLKAFHNEEDGQAYSNVDSVFQEFYVIWNYIYTGTPIALKRMVNEQNFGSGLATRLTCIPLPATNFEMMSRESFVDYDSDNRLKEWAEKLDKMKGELSVQKIVDELYDWTARRMEDAKENDSKADEMLLKRCAYHGLNFSAPFIVMRHWDKMKQDGQYWCGEFETDDVDWKLAELIVNIQYACQRHYFGAMAENYFDNKLKDASVNVQRKQKTFEAFNRLPDEFTIEDVVHCFNLGSAASARKKVTRLCRDHLIEKVSEDKGGEKAVFHKTGSIML
ncbi:BT4734/BF3469 family protein [Xylanibacter ruminicola]|uniref:VirE N-terminal domain-containing protein n=1 Tax=Xylanibacter ruminicola TaxID=839 RepID=A0A1M6TKB3_XYLRU|nr:BT4734/BF3469 family protein [Xylanibacter ruminicola]SHK57425.1 VirE N-terminal domain-containing protein [Xylanibacter ruminicola]